MSRPPVTVVERRLAVERLAAEGLSARAIATRLGVGKDTVRRDLAHLARATAPASSAGPEPARATVTITVSGRAVADLDLLVRVGLPDPDDAVRWALERAAAEVCAEWSRTGRQPVIEA